MTANSMPARAMKALAAAIRNARLALTGQEKPGRWPDGYLKAEADEPHGDVPALPRYCLSCGVDAGTPCPLEEPACHFAGTRGSAHGFTEGSDM